MTQAALLQPSDFANRAKRQLCELQAINGLTKGLLLAPA